MRVELTTLRLGGATCSDFDGVPDCQPRKEDESNACPLGPLGF